MLLTSDKEEGFAVLPNTVSMSKAELALVSGFDSCNNAKKMHKELNLYKLSRSLNGDFYTFLWFQNL